MTYRSSRPDVFCKKDVLRNFAKFAEKHFCEFCEISKSTFFQTTPVVAASTCSLEKIFLQVLLLKVCESFLLMQIKVNRLIVVYFDLYEISLHFWRDGQITVVYGKYITFFICRD